MMEEFYTLMNKVTSLKTIRYLYLIIINVIMTNNRILNIKSSFFLKRRQRQNMCKTSYLITIVTSKYIWLDHRSSKKGLDMFWRDLSCGASTIVPETRSSSEGPAVWRHQWDSSSRPQANRETNKLKQYYNQYNYFLASTLTYVSIKVERSLAVSEPSLLRWTARIVTLYVLWRGPRS